MLSNYHNHFFITGPQNWFQVGGLEESTWTPSDDLGEYDYWYRLQYDPETARFEEIFPTLLTGLSEIDNIKGDCKICQALEIKAKKSVPTKSGNGFVLDGENYEVFFEYYIV